jgi:hypothetical protein
MPIRFACEQCGHPFEVEDRLAGRLGRCKRCGHVTEIPEHPEPAPAPASPPSGLRLRPLDDEALDDTREVHPAPALRVRPVATEVHPLPSELNADDIDSDAKPAPPPRVLDPEGRDRRQARSTRLNPHYPERLARFVARVLRLMRDWLYLISIGFLAVAAVGYAFKIRPVLHLGATGVVAANVGMLVVGVFYLVTLPFKESVPAGLATLLFPPYAVYYWVSHWPEMRKPVINTLRSFTPIFLVGLAYLFYTEAPAIERQVERVEKFVEEEEKALEHRDEPARPAADEAPAAEPPETGKAPAPF